MRRPRVSGQASAMGMTISLLFLVQATATACAPAAPVELTGRVEVVQAVLDFEEEAPEQVAPTLAGVQSGAAPSVAGSDESPLGQAPAPCRPLPMRIA